MPGGSGATDGEATAPRQRVVRAPLHEGIHGEVWQATKVNKERYRLDHCRFSVL